MATTRTKALVALGALDIARQASHALSARQQVRRDGARSGSTFGADAARLARDARQRAQALGESLPTWRRRPTLGERIRTWFPVLVVMAASTAAVVLAARVIVRQDPGADPDSLATDSRMIGAVRASSRAIEESVEKVVEGGSGAAAGTAATVAAGSAALKQAAVRHAKDEVDTRVVQPAKRKVTLYGALGLAALTVYVIVVATVVQLVVASFT